jgi:hypothetical protein
MRKKLRTDKSLRGFLAETLPRWLIDLSVIHLITNINKEQKFPVDPTAKGNSPQLRIHPQE